MDKITDTIAIGNHAEAADRVLLEQKKVRSVLSLVPTLRGVDPAEHGVEMIDLVELVDGPGNRPETFLLAVETLESLVEHYPLVLVHCHAGRSRSAVVVAGYLMRSQGLSRAAAIAAVAARRDIWITPGLERLLDYVR